MTLPKTTPTSLELKATIALYQHELNNDGKGCVKDCPACHWATRTRDAPWNEQDDRARFR